MEPSAPSFVVDSPTLGAASPIVGKALQTVAYPQSSNTSRSNDR